MLSHALSLCLYRRPEYSRWTLSAAAKQAEFRDIPVYASIDHASEAAQDQLLVLVKEFFPHAVIWKHGRKIGCNANTLSAIEAAFGSGAQFVTHLEDDILLAPDAGSLIRQTAEVYRDDPAVLTAGLWRHDLGWLPGCGREIAGTELSDVRKQAKFTCWGWGTWRDRWEKIIHPNWTAGGDSHHTSWDVVLDQSRQKRDLVEVLPMISRVQNIGREAGTHRRECVLTHWSASEPGGIVRFDTLHHALSQQQF